ncbi:hypothetical protein KOR42_05970 [Thalassoglobus neptunius]|uniref:Uncharacterized protein n=1 Tax=Thalassoglobus neptunius TaxID=1938619 RepID=A0A5C5X3T1_9PLAN|nr:hypothetical protein [Thalassoglobus neptunius]TWT57239.1 hypothetical protein KOR42_05970 [Thalassoglobus neptunius]
MSRFAFVFAVLCLTGSFVQAQTTLYSDSFTNDGSAVNLPSWDTVENGGVWWNDGSDSTPWVTWSGTDSVAHHSLDAIVPGSEHSGIDFGAADVDITFEFNYGTGTTASYDSIFWIRANSDRSEALGIYHSVVDDEFTLVDEDEVDLGETPVASGLTTANTYYTIRILLSGSKISLWVDDVLKIDEWDNSTYQTNTYFGFHAISGGRLDDFSVTDVVTSGISIEVHGDEIVDAGTEDTGSVPQGSWVTVPIEMIGVSASTVTVNNFAVSGDLLFDDSDDFSSFTLDQDETNKIRVRLSAATAGSKTGTVTVTYNTTENYTINVDWTVVAKTPASDVALTKGGGGSAPTDPTRTSYKPGGMWTQVPFAQTVWADETTYIGVIAMQEGGIESVDFWWNGNSVTVNTMTTHDGISAYYCAISPNAASGNEQIYATINAADPYAQEKVLDDPFYFTIFDSATVNEVHVGRGDASAGSGTEGDPYLSLQSAINDLSLTDGGIVTIHEGTVDWPYTATPKANSGVFWLRMAEGEDRYNVVKNFTGTASTSIRLSVERLKVSGIEWDTANAAVFYNRGVSGYYTVWDDIHVGNSDGRFTLVNGNHLNTGSIGRAAGTTDKDGFQNCRFVDTYQGTTGFYSINDYVERVLRDHSTCWSVANMVSRRGDYDYLRDNLAALTITYSGGATATYNLTSTNAGSSRDLVLLEDASPVLTINLKTSSSAVVDTDDADGEIDAHTIAQVVSAINATTDWSASIDTDYTSAAADRQLDATYLKIDAHFSAVTGGAIPVDLYVAADLHVDGIQSSYGTGVAYNRFYYNCDFDNNPADMVATYGNNESDMQGLFIVGTNGGHTDGGAYFMHYKNVDADNASQFIGEMDNFNMMFCTFEGPQIMSPRTDKVGNQEYIPTNVVFRGNAFLHLDNWEDQFGGELYFANNSQVTDDWSAIGYSNTQSANVAAWDLNTDGTVGDSSTLLDRSLNGTAYQTLWPNGDSMASDGSDPIGAWPPEGGVTPTPNGDDDGEESLLLRFAQRTWRPQWRRDMSLLRSQQ